MFSIFSGCTVGSTMVDKQLKEIGVSSINDRQRHKHGVGLTSSSSTYSRVRSDADQSVFRIYKGVKCFDFSKSLNVLATGGQFSLDRHISRFLFG